MTKKESVTDPPVTLLIPIKSLSNKLVSNFSTAETTISAKCYLYPESNLELRAVWAHFINISLLWALSSSTLTPKSLIFPIAAWQAFLNPLMITYWCIPSSMNSLLNFNNSPAIKQTEVVPSPTSSS